MLQGTGVDRLYTDFKALVEHLESGSELSLRNTVDENFRKALLLAAASYFEHRITQDITDFAREIANENDLLVSFLKNKAISRQYHTYFDWKSNNASQFFSLFGSSFSKEIKLLINNDEQFSSSIKAFMEIGRERNRLVHQDFGNFSLEKTSDEIYKLYSDALFFVEALPQKLRQYLPREQ